MLNKQSVFYSTWQASAKSKLFTIKYNRFMTKNPLVDKYIKAFPESTQTVLIQLRELIISLLPDAQEVMGYGIPTYKQSQNLVHFAGYKTHIGFYPTPPVIQAFVKEIKPYKTSKGAVQFPLDKPLPLDLIRAMIEKRILTLV
jgi:uncharacterized protein YdhG (YjbR/CyaY superfamily)